MTRPHLIIRNLWRAPDFVCRSTKHRRFKQRETITDSTYRIYKAQHIRAFTCLGSHLANTFFTRMVPSVWQNKSQVCVPFRRLGVHTLSTAPALHASNGCFVCVVARFNIYRCPSDMFACHAVQGATHGGGTTTQLYGSEPARCNRYGRRGAMAVSLTVPSVMSVATAAAIT